MASRKKSTVAGSSMGRIKFTCDLPAPKILLQNGSLGLPCLEGPVRSYYSKQGLQTTWDFVRIEELRTDQ